MGRSFASFHIYDKINSINPIELEKTYLDKFHDVERETQRRVQAIQRAGLAVKPFSEKALQMLKKQLISERNAVQFQRQKDFSSIFDRSLGFETIAEEARIWSMTDSHLILYTAMYDDDIFVAGLYQDGKAIAAHVVGDDALEAYGFQKCCFQADDLREKLDLKDQKRIEQFCKQTHARKSAGMLEALLGIRLDAERTM